VGFTIGVVDVSKYGAPPSDEEQSPEELVVYLASRDPNSEVYDFPVRSEVMLGRNGKPIKKHRMLVVKGEIKIEAKREASRLIREQFKAEYGHAPTADDMAAHDIHQQYEDLFACELIVRACRGLERINSDGPAIYPAIFESSEWILKKLDSDEIGILFQQVLFTEITKGARDHILDNDPITIKLWLNKIKRGKWALGPLASLASVDLAELLLSCLKHLSLLESSGFPILDPQYLSLLNISESSLETSTEDTSFSGSQLESCTPTIDPEKARELARKMVTGK
jgi:hypothetical protein